MNFCLGLSQIPNGENNKKKFNLDPKIFIAELF